MPTLILCPAATVWTRLLSFVLSLTVLLLAVAPVAATSIETDLWIYAQGDTVNVSGDGFGASEDVELVTTDPYGVETDRGTTQADPNGNIFYSFVLNSDVPGIYDVVGTGLSSGLTASTQFDPTVNVDTTLSLALSSSSIGLGSSVNLSGLLATDPDDNDSADNPLPPGRTIHLMRSTHANCSSPTLIQDVVGNAYSQAYIPSSAGIQYIIAVFEQHTVTTGSGRDQLTVNWKPSDSDCLQLTVTTAKAAGSVSINNIPASAVYGGSFTPTFTTNSDGTTSAVSLTTATCTISAGVVSFDAAGLCTLRASVTEGTNHLAATGAEQSFTIAPRPVTVTVTAGQSKTYGNSDPATFGYSITSGSLAFSDTFSGALSRAAGEDVGAYAIGQNTLSLGTNYDLSFVGDDFTINPAHLTVTADDKTKVLNSANPALTYTITGFKNGETVSVVSGVADCSTTAVLASPISGNPYPITCTAGSLSAANYDFPAANFVVGSLTITYAGPGTFCLGSPGHQILQPVDSDGTSVFKKGSTVPAKFRVCDANGNSIGTAGVVSSFRLIMITSGTAVAFVDEAVVSTTPDTAFRWSATDQQWIYNMNTKNLQANKTYTYEILLNDGTSIRFSFGLK